MTACTDGDAREPAQPVDPSSRVSSIDALRGIALFGVLAINLETEFRVSIFQQFLPHASSQGLSRLIDGALDIFIDMKAFALFSLLFGVGLAIQFERLEATQRTRLLVRRLLILLAFGVIHLFLIWNGDILAEYALAGLVVLPFLFGPTWLIGSACAMLFALFLLGALSWRMGLFDGSPRVSRWLRPAAALLIGAGLVLTVALAAHHTWGPAGTILLALGYAALVVSIEATKIGHRWLRWAQPLGRMAFTNYILQSVILGLVFYGYGLGLFGKLDSVAGLAIVLAVYVAQVVVSRLWLDRFRYGPIEWLWRALMYGRAPPFRKAY